LRMYYDSYAYIDAIISSNDTTPIPLANRIVEVFVNGVSFVNLTTDSSGAIPRQTIELNDATWGISANSTIDIVIQLKYFDYTIENAVFNASIPMEVITAPIIPGDPETPIVQPGPNWTQLILLIVGVVAAIIGIVFAQRFYMDRMRKREFERSKLNLPETMGPVTLLYAFGRLREAVAYTYSIYIKIIREMFHIEKKNSETLRDFAITVVTKYGQDPLRVYPYVQLIESIIYGGRTIDQEGFEDAINMFSRLYWNLTGDVLGYEIPTTELTIDGILNLSTPPAKA